MASLHRKVLERPENERSVQIILVGHDDSAESNRNYLLKQEIPFPALKFEGRDELGDLASTGPGGNGALPFVRIFKADGTLFAEGSEPRLVFQVSQLIESAE
ncbi:MAG: hypothetical protein CMO55_10380 [Verrucomicrobiales bacterium]|nr:hypothetical protein [Verrucomicrobiales bacterium]